MLAPVRERYEALRADEAALEAVLGRRRREGARDRAPRCSPTCARRWASGPRADAPSVRPLADPVLVADLELDLEVFSGPFDLLLTLVLREEVDLLEVELADVVALLPRRPRGARRARPRGGDRVPRADRRAAGAEVAADAAARGRGAARPRARRGGRGAAGADARGAPLPRAPPSTSPSGWRRARPPLPPRAAAARGCARAPLEPAARASTTRRGSARRSAACCGCPPAISCSHLTIPRSPSPSAWRTCAGCCAAARCSFDEAVRGADRVTVAVTLFALLELYKRGEADWEQDETFGEITDRAARGGGRDVRPAPARRWRHERADARARGRRGAAVPLARAGAAAELLAALRVRRRGRARRGARRAARERSRRAARARAARARRRLDAGHRTRGRGGRAPAAGQAAHAAADARAGRDAGDRRLPAAGLAPGDHPHPRRQRRLGRRRRCSSAG